MTTHEKARMIEYINYCDALGDSNRRASRKWDIQYIVGWLAGSAHARHEVAKEMAQYIEVCEITEEIWANETRYVPTASTMPRAKHGTSARSKPRRRKGARIMKRLRNFWRRYNASIQTTAKPTTGGD